MVLESGVCRGCLDDPRRGRRWSEISHRCRSEPAFALAVYRRIATPGGRRLFALAYRDALLAAFARGGSS